MRKGRLVALSLLAALVPAALWGGCRMIRMPGRSFDGPLPPMSGAERRISERLERHVRMLAGQIGERNLWEHAAYESAARYVEMSLGELGYEPRVETFHVEQKPVHNVVAEKAGRGLVDEIVLVGAHYDSVAGSPGANDNASGVAGMLEIARLLRELGLDRTVRFVAFANEEPPFFHSEEMGSFVHARLSRDRDDQIVAMLSVETIGYYDDGPGTQNYPPALGRFFPDRANFISFVSNVSSGDLVRRCIASFRAHARFPSEGIAAPGFIPGLDWSDHWAFWQHGYPAIMITDTALYRYPAYHAEEDKPDQIDYDRTARVVAGLARVVIDLAGVRSQVAASPLTGRKGTE